MLPNRSANKWLSSFQDWNLTEVLLKRPLSSRVLKGPQLPRNRLTPKMIRRLSPGLSSCATSSDFLASGICWIGTCSFWRYQSDRFPGGYVRGQQIRHSSPMTRKWETSLKDHSWVGPTRARSLFQIGESSKHGDFSRQESDPYSDWFRLGFPLNTT